MKDARLKPFDHILHPYLFVLKEGKEIHRDFLDYSLLLLQVGGTDVLHSPHHKKNPHPIIQILKK